MAHSPHGHRPSPVLALGVSVLVFVSACSDRTPPNRVTPVSESSPGTTSTTRFAETKEGSQPEKSTIVLTTHSVQIGDEEARFGSRVRDLPDLFGSDLQTGNSTCQEVEAAEGAVRLLFSEGVLRRAATEDPSVTTPSGISGSSPARELEERFPRRLEKEVLDGEDLYVFVPSTREDRDRRIIFRIRESRVVEMRAGLLPWVYWESCP